MLNNNQSIIFLNSRKLVAY